MLRAALDACVNELAGVVPVQAHGVTRGIFDPTELGRLVTRDSAIYLYCAALTPDEDAGQGDAFDYTADLILYTVVRGLQVDARLDTLLDALIVPLLGYIPGQRWGGDPWTGGAETPAARSLYATTSDAQGLALWAIEWTQTLRLPRLRAAT